MLTPTAKMLRLSYRLKRTAGDDSPLVKRRRSASGDRVDVPPEASDDVDPHSKLIDLIFRTSF